jgi:hypothetical protein
VSSLERYLLGSYGLRYHRDRSRGNVSSKVPVRAAIKRILCEFSNDSGAIYQMIRGAKNPNPKRTSDWKLK